MVEGAKIAPNPIYTSTCYAVCFSSPDNEIQHMVDTIFSGVGMSEVHCLATTEARFKALTEIEKQFSILNKCSTALKFGEDFRAQELMNWVLTRATRHKYEMGSLR